MGTPRGRSKLTLRCVTGGEDFTGTSGRAYRTSADPRFDMFGKPTGT
jgi:hypothetical protein